MIRPADMNELKSEVTMVQRAHPDLLPDNAFVLWFLKAFLVDDERAAREAIVGRANDKGVDAVFIDHPNRKAFVIQGKYRTTLKPKNETRPDLISFAGLARSLHGSKDEIRKVLAGADSVVRDRLEATHAALRRRDYALSLYFATTGKVSPSLEGDAQGEVKLANGPAELNVFGRRQILNLVRDYLDGAAPPVPSLSLPIEAGDGMIGGGIAKRFDPKSKVESWVFSMLGSDVGRLFEQANIRLFARNIRGFLGSTQINRAMKVTLKDFPENFWYFNNGVTMVCDKATKMEERGKQILKVLNPQIINGQQTTRILKESGSPKASVLVRVIAIPRGEDRGKSNFDELVSNIVAATNWQNAINPSDLRSNDPEQVRIERDFRRLNYQYLRKRQSKTEARRLFGTPGRFQVKKEDLAKAIAACELDPVVVRSGKEQLFENEYYSKIFCGRPAKEYLMHLWLDRIVRFNAAHRPERAYARWLVLNFTWQNLEKLLGKRSMRDQLIRVCENKSEEWRLRGLDTFVDYSFRAALSFFKAKRGKGAEAIDVSTFFKRVRLDEQFAKYWRSQSNKYRGKARKAIQKFERELREVEEE